MRKGRRGLLQGLTKLSKLSKIALLCFPHRSLSAPGFAGSVPSPACSRLVIFKNKLNEEKCLYLGLALDLNCPGSPGPGRARRAPHNRRNELLITSPAPPGTGRDRGAPDVPAGDTGSVPLLCGMPWGRQGPAGQSQPGSRARWIRREWLIPHPLNPAVGFAAGSVGHPWVGAVGQQGWLVLRPWRGKVSPGLQLPLSICQGKQLQRGWSFA